MSGDYGRASNIGVVSKVERTIEALVVDEVDLW